MIDIVVIFVASVIVLLAFFYLANKQNKKSVRIVIKTIGAALGFIIYVFLNALLNTDFQTSTNIGTFYIVVILLLLFVQRNKFKEQ